MNTHHQETAEKQHHIRPEEILPKIRKACTSFNISSLNRQREACEGLFTESQIIDVAVLGQFKAGKTSFINSLIGTSVLPVGVIPITTVITRITRVRYGIRERVTVRFLDGKQLEIRLGEIEDFISEAKNSANRKNVAIVDIEFPVGEHYHGLRLVDTPGLGSAHKYTTVTSEEWLPKVGAAIVAISSDRPLSESDLRLIQELMKYTPEIILLLTKVDLLTPDQQNEVIRFLNETVQQECNRTFPVFLYSTKSNTEFYKQLLDVELLIPLSQNIDRELKKIFQHKILSLARTCTSYLDIALKASLQADHDREEVKKLILDEKVNFDLIRSELFLIAREHMLHTRTLIAKYLEATYKLPLTRKFISELKNEMKGWKGNLWKITRRYEQWLMGEMMQEMNIISLSKHEHFFESLNNARAAISRSLILFKNHLDSNIEKVLKIRLSEADWNIEVAKPTCPDIAFTQSFEFHLDLLWFLIPMVIFRKTFERHFLNQIPWAVEVNLSRLAYQWEVNINKAIEVMKNRALAYVQEELSTIETLLSNTHGQTDAIRQALKEIQDYLPDS